MPYISRLKKLGTLPVSELQTILTVHLINLENSQQTNFVYTSSVPIPPDATPPAHLRFDCSEGHTKCGDVLLWASRTRKKACFVQAYWVFDGRVWVRPSSDSEVMMVHPEHSEYQLAILSGPYIKWELKRDLDLSPEPPSRRLRVRGSQNIISPPAQLQQRPAEDSATKRHESHRTHDQSMVSGTPDGSAVLCSSSRFSTPLSDVPHEAKPEFSPSQPAICHSSGTPLAELSKFHLPESSISRVDDGTSTRLNDGAAESVPAGDQTPINPVRPLPKRMRSSPPACLMTPTADAPPTPDSSKQARSRATRNQSFSDDSAAFSRRPKRRRSGHEDHFVLPASASGPIPESLPQNGAFASAPKRRRLDVDGSSQPRFMITLPSVQSGGKGATLRLLDDDDSANNTGSDKSDSQSDSDDSGNGDLWGKLDGLQKEEEKLAERLQGAAALVAAHGKLAKEGRKKDGLIEELHRQMAETQRRVSDLEVLETTKNSLEAQLAALRDQAAKESLKMQQWKDEAAEVRWREKAELDAALAQVRQLEEDKIRSDASGLESAKVFEVQLTQLRGESNNARQALEDLKARAADEMRLISDRFNETREQVQLLEGQKRQLETFLSECKEASESQLAALQSERNALAEELQRRHEQTTGQLDEHRRRAVNFESSLRVAQDALQRQRSQAQETEAQQRSVITQLAKDLQENDRGAKILVEEGEGMKSRIEDLQKALSASEAALYEERDNTKHLKAEMEQTKQATKEDRLEIARLSATIAVDADDIAAAKEEASRLRAQVDLLLEERSDREAALTEEIRAVAEANGRAQELQKSTLFLDQVRKRTEADLLQERSARTDLESQLTAQSARFDDHLALTDKEQGRLEELFLECRSSLQLELKTRTSDLESARVECAKLKDELSSEREWLSNELSSCQERLTTALDERTMFRDRANATAQRLETALVDHAQAMTCLSDERDASRKELSTARTQLEQELSVCRENLAESLSEREQINRERAALQLESRAQAQRLETAEAECMRFKADLSSERERCTSELSATTKRFEGDLATSREQLAAVREEQKTAEQTFQALRASLELEACRTAEALKTAHADASKLDTTLCAERGRFSAELNTLRDQAAEYVERMAAAEKGRLLHAEELFAQERASLQDDSKIKDQNLQKALADCAQVVTELSDERQRVQNMRSDHEKLEKELIACRSLLDAAKAQSEHLEEEHATLRTISNSVSREWEASQTECLRLKAELSFELERFREERSMSPDALRAKLSSTQACLEHERATSRTLRAELAKEQSSNYLSDLGSQLLRSLHEVQDQLKGEQIAREALQDELASERSRASSFAAPLASMTKIQLARFGPDAPAVSTGGGDSTARVTPCFSLPQQ